jgi:surfeit locus 1 family protein
MTLIRLFSRKWLLATFIVAAGTLFMARLGFWQLDRLEQRRAFNQRVLAQINQSVLFLSDQTLDVDLIGMEYRKVTVTGEYEPSGEIALRNQAWQNKYGVHLLTPLRITGTDRYIYVDRGWIPGEDFDAGLIEGSWQDFNEPGIQTVNGVIRRSQMKADFGRISDPVPVAGQERIMAWNLVNIELIKKQAPFDLLPVYIQQSPERDWKNLPYRSEPDIELSEGSHMGYAIQWFTFAALLFFGYPFYVQKEESRQLGEKIDPSAESQFPVPGN